MVELKPSFLLGFTILPSVDVYHISLFGGIVGISIASVSIAV